MNSETVSKRKRVDFSKEEVSVLEEAYKSGLKNTEKQFQTEIKSISDKLNISELRIKYWIGNRRKKEERAIGKVYKRKKSRRFPSSYNLFATSIKRGETSGATYLRTLAADWSQISQEEKKKYKEKAEEFKKEPLKHLDRNTCIKAQLEKIKSAVVVLDSLGYTIGGFGIDTSEPESDKNSFHFVTSKSETFFTCGMFEKFQSQLMGTTEIVVGNKNDDLKKFRQKLRKHWNKCWKKSTGQTSLIPYSDIKNGVLTVNVDGLPQDLSFRNPNYYSVANLKRLLKLPVSFQIKGHINSSEDKGKAELPTEIPVEVEGISITDNVENPEDHIGSYINQLLNQVTQNEGGGSEFSEIPVEVEGISITDNVENPEDHIGRDINQLLNQVTQNEREVSEFSGGNKKQRKTKTVYTRHRRKNNKKAKKEVFTDDQSDKRDSKAYRIEKILKKKKNKLLVRWADDKSESWIFADDMVTDENELSTL